MTYPFSRLIFKDSDYETKTPKARTDQIRKQKYKKGEGGYGAHNSAVLS